MKADIIIAFQLTKPSLTACLTPRGQPQLAPCHLPRYVQEKPSPGVSHAGKQPAELFKKPCLFGSPPPSDLVGGLPLSQVDQLWRPFALVEELVERNLEGAGPFLQGID